MTNKMHVSIKAIIMFPSGTLSFQASQEIRSGKDISLNINTTKFFLGKIGEQYNLKMKTHNTPEDSKSMESTIMKPWKISSQMRRILIVRYQNRNQLRRKICLSYLSNTLTLPRPHEID